MWSNSVENALATFGDVLTGAHVTNVTKQILFSLLMTDARGYIEGAR